MTDESKEKKMSEAKVIDVPTKDDVEVIETTDEVGGGDDYTSDPEPEAQVPAIPDSTEVSLDIPITPEMSELTRMAQLATTFANAQLVPKALREKPADVLLVMMTARSLGIDYPTGFRELFVIDGKVSLSTKAKLALVRRSGIVKMWPDPGNDDKSATWYAVRVDTPEVTYSSTFTISDAKAAKLLGKDNWIMYPARMLSWRALGYLIDDAVPEVATGLYSPDELGAVTDDEGNVIDVSEVQPLVQSDKDERKAEQQASNEEIAPEEDRLELAQRVEALPDEVKEGAEGLRERWKDATLPPPMRMPKGKLRRAKALVKGFEAKASRLNKAAESAVTDPGVSGDAKPEETQETAQEPPASEAEKPWTRTDYPEDVDEQRKQVAIELAEVVEGVEPSIISEISGQVEGMSWQAVDKELRERGDNPDGLHIDSRRMLLTAFLIAERPMDGSD